MLKIFNKLKKKNYNVYRNIPKKSNNKVDITRHYPPANKE
jgi:hypothetical protein